MITTAEFQRAEILVGRVLAAEEFPKARNPSYRLTIDLGVMGTRQSVAALKNDYRCEELPGHQASPKGGGNLNQQHCRSAAEDLRNSGTGTI